MALGIVPAVLAASYSNCSFAVFRTIATNQKVHVARKI
jgi:hypothetical protein